jgi:Protein of unknown function (DUF3102)
MEEVEGDVVEVQIDLPATAARIKDFWGRTAAGVLEVGRELNRVKGWVEDGEFTEWVEEHLPFTLRTAQRLMTVARHPVLADPTHASCLPASWATLDALAHVDPEVLKNAIADGRVSCKMERKDVAALDPDKKEKKEKTKSLRQRREAAERLLRTTLAAITKLVAVNVQHLDPKRAAGWADELGSAMVVVERFCETLVPAHEETPTPVPEFMKNDDPNEGKENMFSEEHAP